MMRDFIKEQLQKSLNFYLALCKQKEESGQVEFKENEYHLQTAYDFLSKGSSSLHLYIDAFDEYLKDANNKYYKAALTNELKEMVSLYFTKENLRFYDAHYIDYLEKLETASYSFLNKSYDRIRLLMKVSLPGVAIFRSDFPTYLFVLKREPLAKIMGIITDMYICLLLRLTYEILKPIFMAEGSFARENNYERKVFQRTRNKKLNRAGKDDKSEKGIYINKWRNGTVTLSEWRMHPEIDILGEIRRRFFSSEEARIRQHLIKLFEEAVDVYFKIHSQRFDDINPESEKREVAKRDLKLLADLIDGAINDAQDSRLQSVFGMKNWKRFPSQIDSLLRRKRLRGEHLDIHSEHCLLDAKVLLRYKRHLEDYLKSCGKEAHKGFLSSKRAASSSEDHASFQYIQMEHGKPSIKDPDRARDRFERLLNLLKEHKMVSGATTLPQFKKIFSGEGIETPVLWVGCRGDLKVFIQQLTDKKKVKDLNQQHWKVANKCFAIEIEEKGANRTKVKVVKKLEEINIKSQKETKNQQFIERMVDIL